MLELRILVLMIYQDEIRPKLEYRYQWLTERP